MDESYAWNWRADLYDMPLEELRELEMLVSETIERREQEASLYKQLQFVLKEAERAGYHFYLERDGFNVNLNHAYGYGEIVIKNQK